MSKKLKNVMSGVDIKNNAHRSAFDLSHKKSFTAKVGELLPIHVEDVAPGEYHRIATSLFTRTQPCQTAAFCRFKEHVDWFFVPYHLLWRYYNNFIVQTNANEWALSSGQSPSSDYGEPLFNHHPYFTINNWMSAFAKIDKDNTLKNNPLGYNRKLLSTKLFEYLGYGNFSERIENTSSEIARNIFPVLAYHKVYNDYYRNQQWELPSPHTYNLDYISNGANLQVGFDKSPNLDYPQLFDLRYVDYEKDYFTGALPSKQYGDTALAKPIVGNLIDLHSNSGNSDQLSFLSGSAASIDDSSRISATDITLTSEDTSIIGDLGLDYLGIRKAEALQKFREIQQSGRTDYKSQVRKHFNVNVADELSHLSTWIGGTTRAFGLDEVVNTNIGEGNQSAVIRGKGVNLTDDYIEFKVPEHGILICMYHCSLLPDYRASLCVDKLTLKTQPGDYIIPELDSIGMQPLYSAEADVRLPFLFDSPDYNHASSIVGYVPRYAEYKTKTDVVCGAFNKSLQNWVTPRSPITDIDVFSGSGVAPMNSDGSIVNNDNRLQIFKTATRLKINPNILNNIFGVAADASVDTDQLLINCNFAHHAVRPLSVNGLPY